MRDPDRITPLLIRLEAYWKKNPDLRLGQIIVNAEGTLNDIFYVEDEFLLHNIDGLSECAGCGEGRILFPHVVGTLGQAADFYGCYDCAKDMRDGTV